MSSTISVLDPTAPYRTEDLQKRHALDRLAGKVVGFVDNGKPNFNFLVDDLSEQLVAHYGVKSVIKHQKRQASSPASDEVMNDLSERCDLVDTGTGD
jgi:hypothetical protein